MHAGLLNCQISIEHKQVVQDLTFGTEIITWISILMLPGSPSIPVRLFANVFDLPPSRSEAVRNGLETARNQTRFTIRYRTGVDSSMRIVLHEETDRIFNIVGGPAQIGRRQWLELVGEEYSS
jgi:head-tail adaptor